MKNCRRFKARHWFSLGATFGVCLISPFSLIAQGASPLESAWVSPQVVYSLVGILLAIGAASQMVKDDRRRITILEIEAVRQKVLDQTMLRIESEILSLKEMIREIARGQR
mgnify:CR=1 FL=1